MDSSYYGGDAISNQRLVSIDNNSVTFLYKDYARGNCRQPMTLTADEFLRRLSLHILPRGFVRVRAFGPRQRPATPWP